MWNRPRKTKECSDWWSHEWIFVAGALTQAWKAKRGLIWCVLGLESHHTFWLAALWTTSGLYGKAPSVPVEDDYSLTWWPPLLKPSNGGGGTWKGNATANLLETLQASLSMGLTSCSRQEWANGCLRLNEPIGTELRSWQRRKPWLLS